MQRKRRAIQRIDSESPVEEQTELQRSEIKTRHDDTSKFKQSTTTIPKYVEIEARSNNRTWRARKVIEDVTIIGKSARSDHPQITSEEDQTSGEETYEEEEEEEIDQNNPEEEEENNRIEENDQYDADEEIDNYFYGSSQPTIMASPISTTLTNESLGTFLEENHTFLNLGNTMGERWRM